MLDRDHPRKGSQFGTRRSTKLPKSKNFSIYVPARLVKLAQQAGPSTVEVVEVVALDLHPEAQ